MDFFSLFPAHAGVILMEHFFHKGLTTFPRTRGGDPMFDTEIGIPNTFSPHTRG